MVGHLAGCRQSMRNHKSCSHHQQLLLFLLTCLMIAAINAESRRRCLGHKSKNFQ